MSVAARLKELNIELPTPAKAVATYTPYVITGKNVFVSGQLPMQNGQVEFVGKVGEDITIEQAQLAARLCALNLLAQLREACDGDLDKVVRCVKLGAFVNCVDGFTAQSKVANGASDLMVEILGEKGIHARAAVGTNALPLGVAVEIEAIFEIK